MTIYKHIIAGACALSLWSDLAGAFCVESGSDGTLTSGPLAESSCQSLFNELVSYTKQESKGIELFTVQKKSGHYYKICNSPQMKAHFKSNFGIASVKPSCETVCLTASQLGDKYCGSGQNGIAGYQYLGEGDQCMKVKVCNYRKK